MEGPSFALVAKATQWLVSGGIVSLEWMTFGPFVVQFFVWLLACGAVAAAAFLTSRARVRGRLFALLFASAAVIAGCCGYLTPFSWWSPVVYCRVTGAGQFAFQLNNLFAIPWLLGVFFLGMAMLSRIALECPRCGDQSISFRAIWLRSTFGIHRCPVCGGSCRIRHPLWHFLLSGVVVITSIAMGYRLGGWTGVIAALSVALVADAWIDYHSIRSFGLLAAIEDGPDANRPPPL